MEGQQYHSNLNIATSYFLYLGKGSFSFSNLWREGLMQHLNNISKKPLKPFKKKCVSFLPKGNCCIIGILFFLKDIKKKVKRSLNPAAQLSALFNQWEDSAKLGRTVSPRGSVCMDARLVLQLISSVIFGKRLILAEPQFPPSSVKGDDDKNNILTCPYVLLDLTKYYFLF